VRRPPTRIALTAGAILIAALAIRVWEVQRTAYRPINDAGSYLMLASEVASTGDYSTSRAPGSAAGGTRGPSAYFPPGYPYFLAAVDLIDGHATARGSAIHPARLSQALLGTVTVALIGLVALEAFGSVAVALIALALAAVYPVLVELSGTLAAENLFTSLLLAATWAALRAGRSERPYRWLAATGVLAGLAILTHVNGIVLVLPLAAAALRARRKVAAPALLLTAALLTVTPWIVRNAILLHHFVPISDETGITLVGTYNPASAAYRPVPYKWRLYYGIPGERPLIHRSRHLTELELSRRLESQALHYIGAHPLSPFAVTFHNSLRLLELEGAFAWRASAAAADLPVRTAQVGVVSFWILGLLALAGAFTRAVRRVPLWLWAMPLLLWLSVAAVNAETPRFREPVDPFLILLAACALASGVELARERLGARAPIRSKAGTSVTHPGEPVEVGKRLP
jgi:4-amino-4-deoxy-L-arabinose transferase-like glycosyltransferase